MTKLQKISEKGNQAVRHLRAQKFLAGQPFMIYSQELPRNEVYLEQPSGLIQLVRVMHGKREFFVIRELSEIEARSLRMRYKLS